MTDPEKTEDVEEALRKLTKWASVGYCAHHDPSDNEGAPWEDWKLTLRSRLEEVEEERDRWEDEAGHNLSIIRDLRDRALANQKAARERLRKLHASRRRVDRLEEVVREAKNDLDRAKEARTYQRRTEPIVSARDRLRSALDSREDEGCTCDPDVLHQPGCGLFSGPVHADEPEGDEGDTKAEPGPPRCESAPDEYSRCDRRAGHDGPHRDYFGKEWPTDEPEGDRTCCGAPPAEECHDCPEPTDEPVSGEGERGDV